MYQKIVSLEDLSRIIAGLKAEGKTVAHCHGCFDLLHPGHIKHFEAARKLADVLVVTLTQDKYVNKGPGRPLFNEQIRAETIAAIAVVDYVAINQWDTAIETVKLIKPSFYIKGQDYKDAGQDLTGNILKEKEAIESVGGKLVFTEEIQFSSSKLINAHFSQYPEHVREFIAGFKKQYNPDEVIREIERLKDIRVLVIGDTIIDEYHYCVPLGKSSKSPTISSKFLREEAYAGGTLAIANHLAEFAGKVDMVTVLGAEHSRKDVIDAKLSTKVTPHYFYRNDGPTPIKRRYVDQYMNIKVFEVTFMNDAFLPPALEVEVLGFLDQHLHAYDMVLIADFGHGMITPAVQNRLSGIDTFVSVNAQTNSNNFGFNYITKYRDVDYISIDEKELRLPFGDKHGDLKRLIHQLETVTNCPRINITLGAEGSLLWQGGSFYTAPAMALSVKDSVGAGDAVLSITALLEYSGCNPAFIPLIGNCTGAIAVTIIGNEHPVYKKDLTKFISHFLK